MNSIDNHVDWTAPATPGSERVAPTLSSRAKQPDVVRPKRTVVDTLLGDGRLTAYETAGSDPYNATGRQFRR